MNPHNGMQEYTPLPRKVSRNPQPSARRYPGTAKDHPGPRYHFDVQYDQIREEREPKLEEWGDDNTPDLSTFRFHKEDHTLGNLISQRLLKYPEIMFSGYKMGPLNFNFDLRVQTDSSTTPRDAVVRCCRDVIKDLDILEASVMAECIGSRKVTEYEQARDAAAAIAEQPTTLTATEKQERPRSGRQWYRHGHRFTGRAQGISMESGTGTMDAATVFYEVVARYSIRCSQ